MHDAEAHSHTVRDFSLQLLSPEATEPPTQQQEKLEQSSKAESGYGRQKNAQEGRQCRHVPVRSKCGFEPQCQLC